MQFTWQNEEFEGERNDKIDFLFSLFLVVGTPTFFNSSPVLGEVPEGRRGLLSSLVSRLNS